MGFLVGNDFIPHLPHLHINHDALPLLYGTYIAILPELGGKTNFTANLVPAHPRDFPPLLDNCMHDQIRKTYGFLLL